MAMVNVREDNRAKSQAQSQEIGVSYLLWLGGLLGVSGLHRFYNRRFGTGMLWFLTLGLFGIGQFIDLFLIPDMVEDRRLKQMLRGGNGPVGSFTSAGATVQAVESPASDEELMVKLLRAASKHNGRLSVTQGVMATGATFDRVEVVLRNMVDSGYVSVANDLETGIVLYDFHELD